MLASYMDTLPFHLLFAWGKQLEAEPSVWTPATHMTDLEKAPSSWL